MRCEGGWAGLGEQVRLLESGELSLEESLDVYKYGVELSKVCAGKLEAVKQEVEKIVITDSNEAGFELEPFQDVEG